MKWLRGILALLALTAAFVAGRVSTRTESIVDEARADDKKEVSKADEKSAELRGWKKGKGWGWVWGKDDEVGSLNAMTPATIKSALELVKEGKVYDLGVPYDRESFKWPGHSPGEILTFRGPEGVKRQGDFKAVADAKLNPKKMAWHSCALFINDNVGTQIDGLGHITVGDDNHWYNGFKEADWGGNWGIRKCDATTIPPIITRGVLIDVAALRKTDALPSNYKITSTDLQGALERQKTKPHRRVALLGRQRQRPQETGRPRQRRHRPGRGEVAGGAAGGHPDRLRHVGFGKRPAGERAGRVHPRASLPARRTGRPHRRVPLPGRPGEGQGVRVLLRVHDQQDPRHHGRLHAAADRSAVNGEDCEDEVRGGGRAGCSLSLVAG
jgi:hypothetical protein